MSDFSVKTIKPASGFRKTIEPRKKPRRKIRGVMFFILIIIFLILFTYILPSVNIIVVPETENIEREYNIQLTTDSSKVDAAKNIFAGKIVEVNQEIEDNFAATGEKDVGDKASGQVIFYNQTGRSQPLTAQIELINDQGVIFFVKESVTIPSAHVDDQGDIVPGEMTANIEAKEAGEKGNVGPGRINISALDLERQSKVYGEIKNALSGGNSKITTIVSQEDLDNAQDELFKKLEPEIKEKIKKKAGEDMTFSEKLVIYDDSETEHEFEVESEVKSFAFKLNLKAKALVYNNKELRIFLRDKILSELPTGQTVADTEFGNLEIEIQDFDIELGLANLKIKAIFPVAEDIDLDEIKQNILGKKEQDARRYILTFPKVKDVHFSFSLSLRDVIPNNESRVKIKLGEVK